MFYVVQLLTTKIVHFYDKSLKTCHITNIAKIIISRYGAKSNSFLVDVMKCEMRSSHTSIAKKWEIKGSIILTKHLYKVGKEG